MKSHATRRSLGSPLTAHPWIALVLGLTAGMLAPPGHTQETKRFATPNAQGTGYTINYESLAAAADMSEAQKFQVARALRNGEGHIASANVEDIAGFGGRCKIDKFLGIPDGGECTLTADPTATKVLSKLGAFALTNAICLVVDVEDGELTEPFCDLLLEAIVSSTIEPVIDQCADRGQTTSITVGFKLVPPKITGGAKCV